MVYMILITMLFVDPSKHIYDAVIVEEYNNKPLIFKTQEECFEHVSMDIPALKEFAIKQYPEGEASVKNINCVKRKFIDKIQRNV